jgi:hypothetical protein
MLGSRALGVHFLPKVGLGAEAVSARAWSMSWKSLVRSTTSTKGAPLELAVDDPDGGGVLDADALAEGVVGLDEAASLPWGSRAKGRAILWSAANFWVKVGEDVEAGDGGLIGEDGVAVFVAEGLGFGVEPAGVDGGLEAPVVEGEREVVAHPGDVVLGGGLVEQRVGAGAVGALEVFKFDDGDAGAGGGDEGGGVVDLGSARRRRELGDARSGSEDQRREGEQVGYAERAHDGGHFDWTAP